MGDPIRIRIFSNKANKSINMQPLKRKMSKELKEKFTKSKWVWCDFKDFE